MSLAMLQQLWIGNLALTAINSKLTGKLLVWQYNFNSSTKLDNKEDSYSIHLKPSLRKILGKFQSLA